MTWNLIILSEDFRGFAQHLHINTETTYIIVLYNEIP
jgi:hypothetical protein